MKKRSIVIGWLCSYVIILMIPVVTIFVNYAWSKQVIQNEIFEANNLVLNNLGDEIDRYLDREISFYSYLIQGKTFQKVISSWKIDAQFRYDAATLCEEVKRYDSNMSGLIYLKNLDYSICYGGAYDSAYQYRGMKVSLPDLAPYEDWLELLSGEYDEKFFFRSGLHHATSETCLVYSNSIRNFSQYESFNLFVSIPVSVLWELTKSLSDGSRLLIKVGEGEVLALSNQGMVELSEEIALNWSGGKATETGAYMEIYKTSRIQGIEFCLLIPQNEFWRQLRQVRNVLYISVAVTLLVGILCVSVLLKRNFQPVAKLVHKITGSEKKWENEYKLIEDAYSRLVGEKNNMYRHIITQEENMQGSQLLAMMKGRTVKTVEDVVQLEPGQKMMLAGFQVPMMDENQFLQDEVMLFAVNNIFSELMEGELFYRIEDGQYLFYIFVVQDEEVAWKEHFLRSAEYLSAFMQEHLDVAVCGAVSSMIEDPGQLRFIYQDVMEGLRSVELLKKPSIVDMDAREDIGSKRIVQSVTQYVEEHFEDCDLNISTIAEGIGRNPKYISRIFKEETKEGILDYVNRLRIKKAQVLIRSGEFNLKQISRMVGYASPQTFRRAFLKETGMTPANYQENV